MGALATLSRQAGALPALADRLLLDAAIMRLEPEAAFPSGGEMDEMVMQALGWEVRAEPRVRQPARRCRSPWAAVWLPLPRVSESADAVAEFVVPWRWDEGCGRRRGLPFGWCRNGEVFFECNGSTRARALLKAALFAQRWLVMRESGDA